MNHLRLLIASAACTLLAACAVGPTLQERFVERKAADAEAARVLASQAPPGEGLAPWIEVQRKRIQEGRGAAQERFAEQERQCWKRFAVNACISLASDERRAIMDRLRREELTLNDLERKRDAASRLEELGQKQAQ